MKHLIVGTAGHIDHGKSALVKALTNIDPDRLKEEKERGLTIDLGFAHFDLPDGTRVAFVDVPGHERFVKNMLAGAAGMDIVILVIDATESVMPQTREHLDIMRLLNVSRGIVAVTKIDLADDEMIEIVEAEAQELVEGTFLENAPLVRVSSRTGEGLDEIRRLIAEAVDAQQQKNEDGIFRFPIDRVFTMKGFGTVVTGTVFSGWISEDEPVLVLPSGFTSRARQLQSHNVKQERISAGMRASLNLANVAVDDLSRGDTLVRPATAEATHMIDVKVSLLASAPRVLKQLSTVKLYAATSQRVARMQLIDTAVLEPGNGAFAQLRLSQPLCILRGDRIVLRGESPEITIGGGVVLDVAPIRFRRKDRDRGAFLQMLANASFDDTVFAFLAEKAMGARLRELAVRAGEPIDRVRATIDKRLAKDEVVSAGVGDDQLVTTHDNFEQFQHKLIEEVKSFFKATPHRLFMPREELRSRMGPMMAPHLFEKFLTTLSESRKLDVSRDGICLSGRKAQVSKEQQAAKEKMEKIFREAGFAPPTFSQAEEQFENSASARKMASLLIEEGTLQKISPTLAYHKDSLEVAIAKTRDFFTNSDKLGVGDLKDILGISRKHAVPLLEHFDRIGLTTRVGDHRVLKDTSRN